MKLGGVIAIAISVFVWVERHINYELRQRDRLLVFLLTVDDADFRYDGPIPQSRETGIVMLADSCEAALRSLQASAKPLLEKRSFKDVSTEQALAMLNNILRAKWQDNQLVDSLVIHLLC